MSFYYQYCMCTKAQKDHFVSRVRTFDGEGSVFLHENFTEAEQHLKSGLLKEEFWCTTFNDRLIGIRKYFAATAKFPLQHSL